MAETFTFFGKFADAMAFLGEEDQKELCWALVRYGACGEVVDLPPMLAMAFTLMREDIDNSKEARMSGRRGGRSRHKAVPAEPQAPAERKPETYADETVDGPSQEPAKGPSGNGERPLAQTPERPLAQSPQAIPSHTNTNQTNTCQSKPDQEKDAPPYAEIVKALNDATGKAFKANNQRTRRLIHARWAEGYRMDDFLTVISTKAGEWGRDPSMCGYLRPETLFGMKFEGYLNQGRGARGRDYSEYN